MKACVFDIEATALSAVGSGMILCAVIKPLEGKAKVLRYDKLSCPPGHETILLEHIFKELSQYQLWIGHNIKSYDWPMLKSRAVILGVDLPLPAFYYDTLLGFRRLGYRTSLNQIGKPTAALDHVVDFFGLRQAKTKIYPRDHWRTVWETGKERRDAMDNLVAHCVADVAMNEEVYTRLIAADTTARLERLR